jgi:hypothetical protein
MIDIPMAIYLLIPAVLLGLAIRADARRRARSKWEADAQALRPPAKDSPPR